MRHRLRGAVVGVCAAALIVTGCGDDGGSDAPRVARLGFLSASASPSFIDALKDGLRDLGYMEGKNMRLDLRATEHEDELPAIAKEFVAAKVDVIIAGGTRAIEAARAATTSIPIVMTNSGDPVETGLVASMSRPGGNITGLAQSSPQLAPKRLELVKEAFPGTTKVALLLNPDHPSVQLSAQQLRAAAPALALELSTIEFRDGADVAGAFAAAKRAGVGALIVLRDPKTIAAAAAIAGAANDAGLPAMYESANFIAPGGLMVFGPNFADLYRRSASYVDRILKGADPATLPIEQPAEFELLINPTVVAKLGLKLPESVRVRATETAT